ncbi:Het-C-domain-containing protein [Westerdykella ornata]|uniref:Het-C-domain-containing protein n=1 Tax=Westerdykella ornata TaxID=318751 RepID=A0A6A6JSE3_WESOR|nr:Het-C-domain-containing protein [Westerdykella ornata]KAF2279482.1 Het-C-domain-containing protein [Westerdykella ornata]
MMIKRTYFGNWLRDYSQAVDVGTLQRVQAETIRVLIWILSFMSFGYATREFEVTAERLGVYRPEEHIDNPKDYADNKDARQYDPRLRGPVSEEELAIDPHTGMKNYIANERGGWATSSGYVKFSFARSIHFGRMYTHGPSGQRGRDEDLAEALRCLGQGLHCLEDFGAHSNYVELVLREMGYSNVFPHTGVQTQINLHGKQVYPLITGTFGGVDFLHSVLGEATDHFTQSEVDQMNTALSDAAGITGNKQRGAGHSGNPCSALTDALSKVPGTGGLIQEALNLQTASDAQTASNRATAHSDAYSSSRADTHAQPMTFDAPPGAVGGPPGPDIPGTNTDPATIIPKIMPILEFRDKVVRNISAIISKIPGLEKMIETITERVTLFVLSLLAPFIMPIIAAVSKQLKTGSSAVLESAANHQFDVWNNPHGTDPTHSMLSKDHFSNILNEPAGHVAAAILQYVAPRIVYAWDHPDVPVDQVLNDVTSVMHHPAIRDSRNEAHRNMFEVVEKWARNYRKHDLNHALSSESVRAGRNHEGPQDLGEGTMSYHSHAGHSQSHSGVGHQHSGSGSGGGLLGNLTGNLPGGVGHQVGKVFNILGGSGGGHRTREEVDFRPTSSGDPYRPPPSPQPASNWGSFQPYQSAYAGVGQENQEPYHAPPEYNYGDPAAQAHGHTSGYGHGGHYTGGGGVEPAYAVPTAYQQGYEYHQPPPQQGGYGGYGGGGGYDQEPSGTSGRKWGEGGGNSAW